ncbi:MAG: NADH-quinone oxidoreductase subunit N [Bacteroidetes bacterium]|nr:NADH-quinone oxidoreductase subunit N [Bacteroidota bacterium]
MNALFVSAILGVLLMLSSLFIKDRNYIHALALAGLAVLFAINLAEFDGWLLFEMDLSGMLRFDRYALVMNAIGLASFFFYLLLSGSAMEKVGPHHADYLALLFFICAGLFMVTGFESLLILFLGIEVVSIPLYILTGSDKRNLKSNEAALKYFLLGSFSTGLLLLGIAFFYGARGNFMATVSVDPTVVGSSLQLAAVLLLLFAMSFKVSVAPFHFWTPDVYDGAPTVFTSFMATIVKVALFAAFVRLFEDTFSLQFSLWQPWVAGFVVVTLLIGNLTAVFQQSVKRMLAYSSIAQAGFMLLAVYTINGDSKEGLLLYAASYSLATIGIFAVLVYLQDHTFEGFNGLAKKQPIVAASLVIFSLSLAGIPLTGGFLAKLFMIKAALAYQPWLAIVSVVMAVVSVFYYFRLIQAMYFRKDAQSISIEFPKSFPIGLLVTALIVVLLGIFPEAILGLLYF